MVSLDSSEWVEIIWRCRLNNSSCKYSMFTAKFILTVYLIRGLCWKIVILGQFVVANTCHRKNILQTLDDTMNRLEQDSDDWLSYCTASAFSHIAMEMMQT